MGSTPKNSITKYFKSGGVAMTPKSTPCRERGILFKPFLVKNNMKLAPIIRRETLKKEEIDIFDSLVCTFDKECVPDQQLYLAELRSGKHRPRRSKGTIFVDEPEIIVVTAETMNDSSAGKKGKIPRKKLLQFSENRRPSKYGFWKMISRKINGRRPFAKDDIVLDYAVDSDDEWEEEGEGDDCQSDDKDEEQDDLDEDLDDKDKEFFVDHGYLSPSEKGSDDEDADPEARREKGKVKLMTFEAEMQSRKIKVLKLIAHGPYWPKCQEEDPNWSVKLAGFKTMTLSAIKPIPTSFTPGIQKATPLRSLATKMAKSEKKAVKRKNQEKEGGGRGSKRGAPSLV